MADWPNETTIEAFRKAWTLEGEPFWTSVFEMHRDKIQIKNPKVAIGNLEKIFSATFRLANAKGFQAMSLRDLSSETGISMGGLYAYIGSKNDLGSVIEGVLRKYIDQVIGELMTQDLDPVARLRAIIYGEIFMMQSLSPWYYFCYMELKGLDKEQQQQALDLELRFDSLLVDAIQSGISQKQFICDKPALLASSITAQLQQWHLKQWKFRMKDVSMEEYAAHIIDNALRCLSYRAPEKDSEVPRQSIPNYA